MEQVGSLELESKIANILLSNRHRAAVDWFLVLQSGEPRYSTRAVQNECTAAPGSLQEAASRISAHGTTVHAIERPRVAHEMNTSVWPAYEPLQTVTLQTLMQRVFDQHLSWRDCADAVEQAEQRNGAQYHVIVRMRDISLILRPFLLEQPLRRMMASADKTMLIPRKHMDSALRGPADHFPFSNQGDWRRLRVTNSETYLKYVPDMLGVPVFAQEDPALMPVTSGRCESSDTFCLMVRLKDFRRPQMSGVSYKQ
eukprot:jgi/Tetstr1/427904/TSEL_017980.t1